MGSFFFMHIQEAHRIAGVKTYYFAKKLQEIRQMQAEGKSIINLGIGSPDLDPDSAVIKSLQSSAANSGVHGYQPYRGLAELRQGFADWYRRHFSVSLDPNSEILPLLGSKEGIMHISMSFLNAGDEVLVPNPGYPAYQSAAKIAGANPVFYSLREENNYLPDMQSLQNMDLSKVKLMWINYPHMPSGAPANPESLKKLVALAREKQFLLCHDNPYSFILNKTPFSILELEGAKEVALELSSLSKNYNMAGWRIGCLACNAEILNTVLKFKSNMDSGMFKPMQIAAARALELPDEWLQKQTEIYTQRREKVWELLDLLDCRYHKNTAGLFVWAKVPDIYSDAEELSEKVLHAHHVFLTPGKIFGTNGTNYIRASLCQDVSTIEKAIERCR